MQVSRTRQPETWDFLDLAPGRGDVATLHALLGQHVRKYSERLFHVEVGQDLDWDEAWQRRDQLTFEPAAGHIAFVPSMVVDAQNHVHVIHEAFNVDRPGTIHVGYKTNACPHWNAATPPVIVDGIDPSPCKAANPSLTLRRDAEGVEWLHVLFHRRPIPATPTESCRPFWYVHNAKPLSVLDPSQGWVGETWFTGFFADQEFRLPGEGGTALTPIIDARGMLHAIGRKKCADRDSVWVYHLSGYPPPPGHDWQLTYAALDSMPLGRSDPGVPGEPLVWVTKQAELGRSDDGEDLDVVWNHNFAEKSVIRREVWFSRLTISTNRWSAPMQITPDDGISSEAARLEHSPDGALHVMYNEPEPHDPTSRIYYVRAVDDPRVRAHWTDPTPVLPEVRTRANRPVFCARGDTVWVGYTCAHDVTDDKDGRTNAWFRMGQALGTESKGDQVWHGQVWLDSDYTVQAGHTLTVLPGTCVLLSPYSRSDLAGYRPGQIDLVVRGRLLALGARSDSIRFLTGVEPVVGGPRWLTVEGGGRARLEFCAR